jgi:hypothetical protein
MGWLKLGGACMSLFLAAQVDTIHFGPHCSPRFTMADDLVKLRRT